MSLGWYAVVVVLAGLVLWVTGELIDSVIGALFFSLFAGGAAFNIGQASIQPVSFFLLFLLAHLLLLLVAKPSNIIGRGLRPNAFLIFYCVYSVVAALYLPKVFARTMTVAPMAPNPRDVYEVMTLGPSRQNLTTAGYMLGAMFASICASAASYSPRSHRTLVNWSIIISWLHVGFGLFGVVAAKAGGMAIIAFFRNAKYAQVDQSNGEIVRVAGIDPEPSSYSAYAFVFLVMMTELWLRGVKPKWTGAAAAALLFMLIICTSSTGYFSLAVYALILTARWIASSKEFRVVKLVIVAAGGLSALCFGLALCAFVPKVAHAVQGVFSAMTVHKLQSTSGIQRTFWVKEAIRAFIKSYGVGVGPGSFRSSSILVAILGSTGVIGAIAFFGHVVAIMLPSSRRPERSVENSIAAATAWAACGSLFPAMVYAAGPEPDVVFALFGGLALGWRAQTVAKALRRSRTRAAAPQPSLETLTPEAVGS
jgi:hypothetical protein